MRGQPELRIKAVNFLELSKYEKTALKAVCVAHMREQVEAGRQKSPIEYIMLCYQPKKEKKDNKNKPKKGIHHFVTCFELSKREVDQGKNFKRAWG